MLECGLFDPCMGPVVVRGEKKQGENARRRLCSAFCELAGVRSSAGRDWTCGACMHARAREQSRDLAAGSAWPGAWRETVWSRAGSKGALQCASATNRATGMAFTKKRKKTRHGAMGASILSPSERGTGGAAALDSKRVGI